MATYPKYWPKVGWFLGLKHTQYDEISSMKIPSTLSTKGPVCPARRDFTVDANTGTLSNRFPESNDADVAKLADLGLAGRRAFSRYWTATLPRNSKVFEAIDKYIQESIKNAPYVPHTRQQRWEAGRLKNGGKLGPMQVLYAARKSNLAKVEDASGLHITKIKVVCNPIHWGNYTTFRDQVNRWNKDIKTIDDIVKFVAPQKTAGDGFRIPVISRHRGEVYLFHGTKKKTANLIAMSSVKPDIIDHPRFIGGYGSLGQGTYLSDNFAKIAIYTTCPGCGSSVACACTGKSGHAKERVAVLSRVVFPSDTETTTEKPTPQTKRSVKEVEKTRCSSASRNIRTATRLSLPSPTTCSWRPIRTKSIRNSSSISNGRALDTNCNRTQTRNGARLKR